MAANMTPGRLPGAVAGRPPRAARQRVVARTRSRLRRERGRAARRSPGCGRVRRRGTPPPSADGVRLARSHATVRLGRLLAPYAVRYVVVVDTLAPSIPGLQTPARRIRSPPTSSRRWAPSSTCARSSPKAASTSSWTTPPPPEGGAERAARRRPRRPRRHRGGAGADGMATRAARLAGRHQRHGPGAGGDRPGRRGPRLGLAAHGAPNGALDHARHPSVTPPPSGWTDRDRSPSPSWARGPTGSRSPWRPRPGWPWRPRSGRPATVARLVVGALDPAGRRGERRRGGDALLPPSESESHPTEQHRGRPTR